MMPMKAKLLGLTLDINSGAAVAGFVSCMHRQLVWNCRCWPWSGQRFADEYTLVRHGHAAPVAFHQAGSAPVVREQQHGIRKLFSDGAGFHHSSIAAGRTRLQPSQGTGLRSRLIRRGEKATEGRKVIG